MPNFVVIPRGQRIARPKRLKFPILVKPVKEEASYGISQASFVETDEQFRERVAFIHEKHDSDVIAEEYIEGRELYVSMMGNMRVDGLSDSRTGLPRSAAGRTEDRDLQSEMGRGISQTLGLAKPVRRGLDPALVANIRRRANASTVC